MYLDGGRNDLSRPGLCLQSHRSHPEAEGDPAGDTARKAQVQTVIARYSDLKAGLNGSYIIDMLCKENDELLAIYK